MIKTYTFRDLGLGVGDIFAAMTNERGQPVMYIHRLDRNSFNVVSVKPGGAEYAISTAANDALPDEQFISMVAREVNLKMDEAEAGVLRLFNRCEGQRRRRTWRMHSLKFKQPEHSWGAGEGVVVVDVMTFNSAWARDDDYYVGPGGHGSKSAQPARYRRFGEWLQSTGGRTPIEMPEVSLGVKWKSGVPQFTNGRHRFAVLRDMGYETVPISVDVYSQPDIERLYGSR
jgi:hypothetical protein